MLERFAVGEIADYRILIFGGRLIKMRSSLTGTVEVTPSQKLFRTISRTRLRSGSEPKANSYHQQEYPTFQDSGAAGLAEKGC